MIECTKILVHLLEFTVQKTKLLPLIILAFLFVLISCESIENKKNLAAPEWGNHLSPEMVLVPGGSFRMGSNDPIDLDAKPTHTVTVSSFFMSKYLVTQELFFAVSGYNPSYFQGGTPPAGLTRAELPKDLTNGHKLPVEQLSWFDAVEFCNKLSILEGLTPVYTITNKIQKGPAYPISSADVSVDWNASGYRLPTEAEWEYAAKGGDGLGPYFIYSGSNDIDAVAWYARDTVLARENLLKSRVGETDSLGFTTGHDVGDDARTYPVGLKEPNKLGLYDMSGNVWEWCWDWFGEYKNAPVTDPRGPDEGTERIRRGGSYSHTIDIIRVAYRDYYGPYNYTGILGFRICRAF